MRRYWNSFLRLLGTESVRSKPMDEATRKERLKRTFERTPVTFFVCLVVTSFLMYFGVLSIDSFIEFALAGLLLVRINLRPLQQLPFSPYSWQFVIYIWSGLWLSEHCVRLPKLLTLWGTICEGPLKAVCAMSYLFTVSSLVTWTFRKPFWQFVTGEKWPEKPSRPKPQDVASSDGASVASASVSALPYNY